VGVMIEETYMGKVKWEGSSLYEYELEKEV
jgi:hypothetical protein